MPSKPLRILTIISPSNYPNFQADSIFVYNKILFEALLQSDDKVEVIVAGSPEMPSLHPRARFIPINVGVSKFEVRLNFRWDEMRDLLLKTQPDVCLVNMPELASAFAVLIKDDLHLPCKLVSYVHYVPAIPSSTTPDGLVYEASMNEHGHGPVLLTRLLQGVIASDLTLIPSNFGVKLLSQVAARLLHTPLGEVAIKVLHPPVDFDEVNKGRGEAEPTAVPRFVYNHRLYDEYGTHLIFNLLSDIYEGEDKPFEVLVTNPTEGRGSERNRLNPVVDKNLNQIRELPFVRIQHFSNRRAYIGALSESWAGLAPHKPHALWSMSVMDVLACGRPVLSYNIAAFNEMGISNDFLVEDDARFKEMFKYLLFSKPRAEQEPHYRSIAEQFSGHSTAQRFKQLISAI
jgi:glycosyltransferase involved in cell wall biosynthesis